MDKPPEFLRFLPYLMAFGCLTFSHSYANTAESSNTECSTETQKFVEISSLEEASDLVTNAFGANGNDRCNMASNSADVLKKGDDVDTLVCNLVTVHEQALWARGYDDCSGKLAEVKWNEILGSDKLFEKAHEYLNGARDIAPFVNQYIQAGADAHEARKAVFDWLRFISSQNQEIVALLDSYTGSGYVRTNAVLRRGGKAASCLQKLIDAEKSAFKTLPEYAGTIWRGLSLSLSDLKKYSVGAEISWPAFSSASISKSVAEDYSRNGSGKATVFKIQSRHCRDLNAINGLQEKEILCLPGTKVKVIGIEQSNVIDLLEVE